MQVGNNVLSKQQTVSNETVVSYKWLWSLLPMALSLVDPLFGQVSWIVLFLYALIKSDRDYLFMLYLLLLVMSDSRSHYFEFAASMKNIVAPFFGIYILFSMSKSGMVNIGGALLPFLVWCMALIAFSNQPFTSFQKLVSYYLLFLTIPILMNNVGRVFFHNYLLFVGAILAIGLFYSQIDPKFTYLIGRYRGMLGNPNGLGIYLVVNFLFYQVAISRFPNILTKRQQYILFALFLMSLILCQSRSAIVVFGLFYFFRFLFTKSSLIAWFVVILLIPSYYYLEQEAPKLLIEYGLGEYFRVDTLREGSGRTIAWEFAWDFIEKSPLVGNGFAYTESLFKEYFLYLSNLGHQGNAHNSYLTLWLDTGLVGLMMFLGPVAYFFVRGSRNLKISFAILICVLFSTFFESWLAASLNPFTIVFVMTLTLLNAKIKPVNAK